MKVIMISPLTKALMVFIMIVFSLNGAFARAVQAASMNPNGQVPSAEPQSFNQSTDNPALLEETSGYVTLELVIPGFEVVQQGNDNQNCQVFKVHNFTETQKPGYPQLPEKLRWLAFPWLLSPALSCLKPTRSRLMASSISACRTPVFEYSNEAEIHYLGEQSSRDLKAYSQDSFFPQSPADLSSTAMIRSQHVAQVTFQPFQYNPMTGKVRYFQRIRVRVFFNQPGGLRLNKTPRLMKAFSRHPEQRIGQQPNCSWFSQQPTKSVGRFSGTVSRIRTAWVKLSFKKSGMAAVSFEILSASGVDLST